MRLREYDLAGGEIAGDALHAGQFELYLEDGARCRLAQLTDWGAGGVHDASTAVVEVGRDAYCHWLPALLGGRLIRHHDELVVAGTGGDMAFRGLLFSEARRARRRVRRRPARDRAVRRRRPLAGRRDRLEPGQLRGPDPDQPRRPAEPHLPAVPLDAALATTAKLDAIPSVLVSADDVSASHGGTVGELDELMIFYMQSRGLTRPQAVRVIVEGFFEPLIVQLDDPPLEQAIRERIGAKLAAAADDIERYALAR